MPSRAKVESITSQFLLEKHDNLRNKIEFLLRPSIATGTDIDIVLSFLNKTSKDIDELKSYYEDLRDRPISSLKDL